MRKIVFLLAAAGTAGLVACTGMGTTTGTSGPPASTVVVADSDFDLTVGQSARVDGTAVTITFNGVTADSRCPLGVMCIQAGNASVSLTVTDGAGVKTPVVLYANPTPQTPTSAKVGGYEIAVVELAPVSRRGVTIPPASYVATLHAAKI
jgi:hypothetical protein